MSFIFPLRGNQWETDPQYSGRNYRQLNPYHWRWGDDSCKDVYLPEGQSTRRPNTPASELSEQRTEYDNNNDGNVDHDNVDLHEFFIDEYKSDDDVGTRK